MERWNGGMDFFLHPFCLLVCLLTIILWLSFQFACFYFRKSCFSTRLCVFVLLFFNFSIGNKSRHSVDKISSETFRHVCYKVYICKLAIAAWK